MIKMNNNKVGLEILSGRVEQSQVQYAQRRVPESKTRGRPPSGGGIGIESPSSHIPLSLLPPKFSCCTKGTKVVSCINDTKIFPCKVVPKIFRIGDWLEVVDGGF